MVICVVLCFVAVWPALWGRRVPAGRDGRHPRLAHHLWPATWRRTPVPATTDASS
jgi:hypothetical protein